MNTDAAAPAAAPEVPAAEQIIDPTSAPSELRVQLGPDQVVTLQELLAAASKDCACNGTAIITLVDSGERTRKLCGCAVGRLRRRHELAKKDAAAAEARAKARAEREVREAERAQRRMTRLAEQLEPLENELQERRRAFEAEQRARREELHAANNAAAAPVFLVDLAKRDIAEAEDLIRSMEEQIARQRARIADARADLEKAQAEAGAAQARREAAIQAVADGEVHFVRHTARLRKDIDKLKQRIARAGAYLPAAPEAA